MSYFDIVLLIYSCNEILLDVEQNQNYFITSKMFSIFMINFRMIEYYTILLNRNEVSFLIFQTGLKILCLSPLIFYVMAIIHSKPHELMAKNGHLLFNT